MAATTPLERMIPEGSPLPADPPPTPPRRGDWRRAIRLPKQILAAAGAALGIAASPALAAADYHREVAPILRAYCAGCHNDADFEGDFSAERYADLREGGSKGDLIAPGDAEGSLLVKMLDGRAKPKMPPDDEPPVPEADLALLKRWIAEGAKPPAEDVSILAKLDVPTIAGSGAAAPITALAYSPDGARLAAAMGPWAPPAAFVASAASSDSGAASASSMIEL